MDATVRPEPPGFAGITLHEVRPRSVLHRVPDSAGMPFRWSVNPYRGCTHACVFCFARRSHAWLELDTGAGFDSQVVVKVGAGEVLARELAAPSWRREPVALGTDVDPYQRAEGRYRVTRGVLEALVAARTPVTVLTKGTLVLRDLDLLTEAARITHSGVTVSLSTIDEHLWRSVEPGTPHPRARLEVAGRAAAVGLSGGVLLGPVLPFLTDDEESVDAAVAAVAASGASWLAPGVLRLPPGAREWWAQWLSREHPSLVARYARLYRGRSRVPDAYEAEVRARVAAAAERHGVVCHAGGRSGHEVPPGAERPPDDEQLTLL